MPQCATKPRTGQQQVFAFVLEVDPVGGVCSRRVGQLLSAAPGFAFLDFELGICDSAGREEERVGAELHGCCKCDL